MPNRYPILFYEGGRKDGELFVLRQTIGGDKINFWYRNDEHAYFYTFLPSDRFNAESKWTKALCQKLVAELQSGKPSFEVDRFAIDGFWLINPEQSATVPKHPKRSGYVKRERDDKYNNPAPFILYGKHRANSRELSWKLWPDKKERQNIHPGDQVIVWTQNGPRVATCTRIEAAENLEQPACRVVRKFDPKKDNF